MLLNSLFYWYSFSSTLQKTSLLKVHFLHYNSHSLFYCFIFCSFILLCSTFCNRAHYQGDRGLVSKATWVTKISSQWFPSGHSYIFCVRKKIFPWALWYHSWETNYFPNICNTIFDITNLCHIRMHTATIWNIILISYILSLP